MRGIQNLTPNLVDVIGSNLSAAALDKQFTNALSAADWHQTIESLQKLLTDSLIQKSLQEMPVPVYSLSRDFLYKRLRQRRDNMLQYGMRYYKIINKEVTITRSNKRYLPLVQNVKGILINRFGHSVDKKPTQK